MQHRFDRRARGEDLPQLCHKQKIKPGPGKHLQINEARASSKTDLPSSLRTFTERERLCRGLESVFAGLE